MPVPDHRTIQPHGIVRPGQNDPGSSFFTDIDNDLIQLDGHQHNGADGSLLAKAQAISTAGWAAVDGSPGTYSQAVTLPTYTNGTVTFQLQFDNITINMRTGDASGVTTANSEPAYPRIVKLSTNSYTVYTNDNSVGFAAFYI